MYALPMLNEEFSFVWKTIVVPSTYKRIEENGGNSIVNAGIIKDPYHRSS